jgi:hypothetical protein
MDRGMVSAADMARNAGIDPKAFRHRLRLGKEQGRFTWHKQKNQRWVAVKDSPEHDELKGELADMNKA